MLTIKKRFPYNKLYIPGSLAFVAGYGIFMSLAGWIPQPYGIDQFAGTPAYATPSEDQSEPEQTQAQQTPAPEPSQQLAAPTRTTTPVTPTAPQTTSPTTPVVTEPALPALPVTPPETETPTDPTNILDDIIDTVTDPLLP